MVYAYRYRRAVGFAGIPEGQNTPHSSFEPLLLLKLLIMGIATALPSWPVALGVFAIGLVIPAVAVWMG